MPIGTTALNAYPDEQGGAAMRTIAAVTTARSDFGHLLPIAREIEKRRNLRLELLVSGSHLWKEFGCTIAEVEASGVRIASRIPFELGSDAYAAMATAFANCTSVFASYFSAHRPDMVLVLGDRYEMLGVVCAAVNSGLAVAHISGGDVTVGAMDDSFRHAITKLSHLHFPSNALSAARIRQMGEEDWRILVVGEPSLDSLAGTAWVPPNGLADLLGVAREEWQPPLLVTLHAETLGSGDAGDQARNVVEVLAGYDGLIVISAANPDPGGQRINDAFRNFARERRNARFVDSLGWTPFASLMKVARAMLGNSSSGLLEAPSFELPVINIGARQEGRLRAANVIDACNETAAMKAALTRALSAEFRDSLRGLRNPYGEGNCANRIADFLEQVELGPRLRAKRFVERSAC